jgi:hypothetical protein
MNLSRACLGALLLAAACGEIAETQLDAGPDAAPVPGAMSLHVVDSADQPVAGATIVIAHADGTPYAANATNQQGTASFQVVRGDHVHVGFADAAAGQKRLYSIVSVAPGDDVTLNRPAVVSSMDGTSLVVEGELPPNFTVDVASNGCGVASGPPPWRLTTRAACIGSDGRANLVARGQDLDAMLPRFLVRTELPATNAMILVQPVDWKPGVPASISVTNVPAAGLVGSFARLQLWRKGVLYEDYSQQVASPPGETQVFDFFHASSEGYPDDAVVLAGVLAGADAASADGQILFLARDPELVGDSSNRSYNEALPRLYAAALSERTFTWMTEGDAPQLARLTAADALYLETSWSGVTGDAGTWIVLAPPGVGSPLELDVGDLAGFAPTGVAGTVVRAFDLDKATSYDQARSLYGASPGADFLARLGKFSGVASFSGAPR